MIKMSKAGVPLSMNSGSMIMSVPPSETISSGSSANNTFFQRLITYNPMIPDGMKLEFFFAKCGEALNYCWPCERLRADGLIIRETHLVSSRVIINNPVIGMLPIKVHLRVASESFYKKKSNNASDRCYWINWVGENPDLYVYSGIWQKYFKVHMLKCRDTHLALGLLLSFEYAHDVDKRGWMEYNGLRLPNKKIPWPWRTCKQGVDDQPKQCTINKSKCKSFRTLSYSWSMLIPNTGMSQTWNKT